MSTTYILALDQGTTSSRALLFDKQGRIISMAQQEFTQIFPRAGWVEHDPMEILTSQMNVARKVLAQSGVMPGQIAAIGITNQRETTIVWDRETGQPIYNAIVWQDRRTAAICDEMKQQGWEPYVKEHTGLVIDAYFSGTKIKWLLDHVSLTNPEIKENRLCFGTVDTWLIWNLTGGKVHATDYSNASRTMLFNIRTLQWDEKLLAKLDIPESMMPIALPSSGYFGETDPSLFDGAKIPISGVAGDQQAALFGQQCFEKGMTKNTYGTGCFMLMNTGDKPVISHSGLLTTIAWGLDDKVTYALEGSVFIAGAAIQWLRDSLKILDESSDSAFYAEKVTDTDGVYVVPAFVGLGAPYWDMYARGAILGLTRGSTKAHIVRATLESLAYQTKDVLDAMEKDAHMLVTKLRVDGGASANQPLMQFQADILNTLVERAGTTETTALGAAYLAGLGSEYWKMNELAAIWETGKAYEPNMDTTRREKLYKGWKKAVSRSMNWVDPDQ